MGDLSLKNLAEANCARAIEWRRGVPGEDVSALFAAIELMGEAGEFANAMKKLERFRLGIVGGTDDQQNAQEELADVVICCSLMANRMGWDLSEIVTRKFNATSAKHGFVTTLKPEEQGRDRADADLLAEAVEQLRGLKGIYKAWHWLKCSDAIEAAAPALARAAERRKAAGNGA